MTQREDDCMKPLRTDSASIRFPLFRAPRPTVAAAPRKPAADYPVLLSIQVESDRLAEVRRALHREIGPALSLYTASIDNLTGRACLQLELARARVSTAMSSIMRLLPEAEFGPIRRPRRSPTS